MKPMTLFLLTALAVGTASAQQTENSPSPDSNGPAFGDLRNADISGVAIAQQNKQGDETLWPRYGVYGSLNFNMHNANFKTLPGIPNCCSQFTEGSGTGGSFGALAEFPVSNSLIVGLRAGLTSNRATLQSAENTVVFVDTAAVPAKFIHTINASPMNIGLSPTVGYRLTGNLWMHTGTEIGYMFKKHFDQEERLMEPEVGQFADGKRTRNVYSQDIPDANPFQAAFLIGTSYDFPINKKGTMIASPEIWYSLGLTNIVKGLNWSANSARLGMSLKYNARPSLPGEEPETPATTSPILAANVNAIGVEPDGREIPLSTMFVEEVVSTNLRPLLNYVFFDENSAAIPERYNLLSSADASAFNIQQLDKSETLPTYYHMLNIIGRRMQEKPSAKITLIGCNSNVGFEHGNRELSARRAETVRDYLRDVWNISENRIQIEARNLPVQPSNISDPDGVMENQRVEILSDTREITEPMYTSDTMRRATLPAIRFLTNTTAEAGVREWQLEAMQDGRVLKSFSGAGEVPQSLDWNVDAEQITVPRAGGEISYQLEVQDMTGEMTTTPIATIPVDHTPVKMKRRDKVAYKEIDRYSLILFGFDKSDLNDANNRVIDRLRSRISANATVTVTGHTDRIGDAEYNRMLSEDRAVLTASKLNASTMIVSGVGEEQPLYTNDLPEGRYYNRTVDIVVETPVKE